MHLEYPNRLGRVSLGKLKEHLIIFVETRATPGATRWGNGAQSAIENMMIAHMVEDVLDEKFGSYVKENTETLRNLLK